MTRGCLAAALYGGVRDVACVQGGTVRLNRGLGVARFVIDVVDLRGVVGLGPAKGGYV